MLEPTRGETLAARLDREGRLSPDELRDPFKRALREAHLVPVCFTSAREDIGVVLDLMIHDLDLVLSMVRSEVVEIDAIGSTIFGPHEDMAHAHLRFANGSIANLNTLLKNSSP